MAPVHRDEKMGYRMVGDTVVFGDPDADTLAQIKRCAEPSETVGSVLCADAHKGYSMPIGGWSLTTGSSRRRGSVSTSPAATRRCAPI